MTDARQRWSTVVGAKSVLPFSKAGEMALIFVKDLYYTHHLMHVSKKIFYI